MKKTFPIGDIKDISYGGAFDGYVWVSKELSHTTRWSIYYALIFTFEGKMWRVMWGEGATEEQESPMWEDEVEADEVEAIEVTVTKYVPVEEGG